ncbi:hypothetical protein J1N35_045161 [Gossypium stocksii]|uniref:Zinc knuckle CX2CX4HX4C domain-containing protein n=1 Tax=Gossypium stocksii TaxID=47602 RepID=A0A9D3UAK2_9ROSI|nr:hypothetical protein J1N35_045161 [Gossypium stocksii]
MDNRLADLSLNEEEDEVLQIQIDSVVVLHKLQWGEDPLRVPLIYAPFWVQVHDVPTGLFSEKLATQLGNFLGSFLEYDCANLGKENRNYMRIRVQMDIGRPLKRKKQVMFNGICSYVKFKYERLSLFCFYCGRLGHNDSFCVVKMVLGVEFAELGWDISIKAQSRRALSMKNIWLREELITKVKVPGRLIGFNEQNMG